MMEVDADYDRFCRYGLGPEENYIDLYKGARLGIWKCSVRENLTRYRVPQESNRSGVRWAEVIDYCGRGLRFTGDAMDFSALPWTPHELENATHSYELPQRHYTVIRASMRQMGIGGDDRWGARTHDEYLIDLPKRIEFRMYFTGILR